ncbi:hypothetical protein [Nocardioides lijunqiniae]|nr:hypothetical protein [Nocardioides lijunqiniae]
MPMELHLATGIVKGRSHSDQDRALLRNVELALLDARRERRNAARAARRG